MHVCSSLLKAEGGYIGSKWKPENLSLNELPGAWLQKPSERLLRAEVLGHLCTVTLYMCVNRTI